jgi:hypothetical protein
MRQFRLACCPLMIWLGMTYVPPRARAAQVVVTVTGTVDYGTDGNPNSNPPGAGKTFGGPASLAGQPFTLTLNFDSSQGKSTYGICPDGSVYDSNNVGGPTAGATAILQIGNGSYFFGTLPLDKFSWTIVRAAPASCTSPYSEIGFSWGETYAGDYAGGSVASISTRRLHCPAGTGAPLFLPHQ